LLTFRDRSFGLLAILGAVLLTSIPTAAQTPAVAYSKLFANQVTAEAVDNAGNQYVALDSRELLIIAPDGHTAQSITLPIFVANMQIDALGNRYIYGQCDSSTCPTVTHTYGTPNSVVQFPAIVAKLTPNGSISFLDVFPGVRPPSLYTQHMAVDGNGAVYFTGSTDCYHVTTPGSYQPTCPPAGPFVTKLDASGTLVFSTFLGGTPFDGSNAIAVDAGGNAYVVGETQATNFPITAGAYRTTPNANPAPFLLKLDASGSRLVYSTYLPGSSTSAVAVDSSGNAYVAGIADAPLPTTPGVVEPTFPTELNNMPGAPGYMLKMSATGSSLVYATYMRILVGAKYCGSASLQVPTIHVDASGAVMVAGKTHRGDVLGSDSPSPAVNAVQNVPGDHVTTLCSDYGDGFVVRLAPDASRYLLATYLGSSDIDGIVGGRTLTDGTVYVGGQMRMNIFPGTVANSPLATNGEGGFVTKLSPSSAAVPVLYPESGSDPGSSSGLALAQLIYAGGVPVGGRETKRFGFGNYGGASLTVTSIVVTGDYSQTNNCPTTLAPGGHCDIDVTFSPTATGVRNGTINVATNASGGISTGTMISSGGVLLDFSIAPAAGATTSQTVAAGQTASYNLTLSPAAGFSGSVTLSCSGSPQETTCSVSPATATLNNAPVNATVTVTTTAPATALLAPNTGAFSSPQIAGLMLGLGALWCASRRRKLLRPAITVVMVVAQAALIGCGGGSSTTTTPTQRGTPAGSYTLVVTATSGSTSHSQNLALIVK
jgi:hypothetical protein